MCFLIKYGSNWYSTCNIACKWLARSSRHLFEVSAGKFSLHFSYKKCNWTNSALCRVYCHNGVMFCPDNWMCSKNTNVKMTRFLSKQKLSVFICSIRNVATCKWGKPFLLFDLWTKCVALLIFNLSLTV